MGVKNNYVTREVNPGTVFPSAKNVISTALSIAQGDHVTFDPTGHLLEVPAAEGDFDSYLGIMQQTIVNGVIQSPYRTAVEASQSLASIPGPLHGVCVQFDLKPGDTLNPGDPVYGYPIAWSKRAVQASGTKQIGVYQGAAVTGGASDNPTQVECLIGHRYPGDVLRF